jgi:hypothetical protein
VLWKHEDTQCFIKDRGGALQSIWRHAGFRLQQNTPVYQHQGRECERYPGCVGQEVGRNAWFSTRVEGSPVISVVSALET